jgi:hypothetical protein
MTEENKEEDLILVDSDFELTSEPEYTKPRDINMSELNTD